jgi:hypothetical protein
MHPNDIVTAIEKDINYDPKSVKVDQVDLQNR